MANIVKISRLTIFSLAIIISIFVYWYIPKLDGLKSWFSVINSITIVTYGYDKAIASTNSTRIPERVLFELASVGGSIAALLSMIVFRHKISKPKFYTKILIIIAVQGFFVYAYYMWILPTINSNQNHLPF